MAQNPKDLGVREWDQALSQPLIRIVQRAKRLPPFLALKRIKKPFRVWSLIAAFLRPAKALVGFSINDTVGVDRLKRPIPAYTMLLVLLVGVAGGAYLSAAMTRGLFLSQPNMPDFSFAVTPSVIVVQGSLATFTVTIESLHNFTGSVNLNATSHDVANLTIALNPNSVSLLTGTGRSILTAFVPIFTPTGVYSMTLTGWSRNLSHSTQVFWTVDPIPPPDFALTTNSTSIILSRGSSVTTSLTLSSLGGFTGSLNLTATVSPVVASGPTATVNPTKISLVSGGTGNSLLSISTSGTTPKRAYTVLVLATSGAFSHSLTITLTVQ